MPSDIPLTREAFLYLAAQAGLDTNSSHLDELYPYVQNVLSGISSLTEIDVGGTEPDEAFVVSPEEY